jgi:hypothetical protein
MPAQCSPDPDDPALATGFTIARGSSMQGQLAADDVTACEFRTAQDVSLWPIEIVSANYFSFAPDLPLNTVPVAQRIKGGVRIRLRTTAGLKFAQTSIDRLTLYLAGRDDVANQLHELCLAAGLGVLARSSKGTSRWHEFLPATAIRPVGFEDSRAAAGHLALFRATPVTGYFAFRSGSASNWSGSRRSSRRRFERAELVILCRDATLESVVDASNFALFCTPAINLFPKRRPYSGLGQRVRALPSSRIDPTLDRDLRRAGVVDTRLEPRAAAFPRSTPPTAWTSSTDCLFHDVANRGYFFPETVDAQLHRPNYFYPWSTLHGAPVETFGVVDPDTLHQSIGVADAVGIGKG